MCHRAATSPDGGELGRFRFTDEHIGQRAAVAVLPGLSGLRVSEACDTDTGCRGFARRHHSLRVWAIDVSRVWRRATSGW